MRYPDERAELIGLIYEAAVDQKVWPLVMDRLADLMGAAVSQVSTYDVAAGVAADVAPRLAPEALRGYEDHWVHHNPLIGAGLSKPVGEVLSIHELMPRSELARTAIYNEFFAPLGLEEKLGASLVSDGSHWAAFGVWRPNRMGAFDRSDADLLAGLIPHLQRALQLNRRLAELEVVRLGSVELLDRLRKASLVVDAVCRVLFANRAAEEILADRIGLHRGADCVLRAGRHVETAALHKLVAGAAALSADGEDGSGGRLRLSRGEDRAPLSVLVVPLPAETSWLASRHPTAMLFVTDPERSSNPTAASLRAEFGLTRMEAALALEVLDGKGLKVAARRLEISPTTARTHLTAVFDKTGTRRQAELVRILLQSGAVCED
jgi:DNA-binding CsgD family transcriptional regulator